MKRDAVRMLLLVGLILLTGCATTPPARLCPVAYGSHGPLDKSLNYVSGIRLTVTVRAISLETGDVQWRGIAMTPIPVKNEDAWLRVLAQAAVGRGGCLIERGDTWDNCEGCKRP